MTQAAEQIHARLAINVVFRRIDPADGDRRIGTASGHMNAWDLVWVGFILLGLVMVAFGVRSLRADRAMLASALRVPGVVTRLRQDSVYSDVMVAGGTVTFPVLRFTTVEGDEVESVSPVAIGKLKVRPGDQVTVLYDPGDPKRRPRIDTVLGRKVTVWRFGPEGARLDDPALIPAGLLPLLLGVVLAGLRLWL